MEPFKELLNESVVRQLGQVFSRVYDDFNDTEFCDSALKRLPELELKERARHIMEALDICLPQNFDHFSEIILACLHPSEDPENDEAAVFGPDGVMGFAAWPVTDLVTHRGIKLPELALPLLKEVTKRFSAEFAVRPFLDQHTEMTLEIFHDWIGDDNRHVRRLVSEGARPRLPWGMQLKKFVAEPSYVLPMLEKLKNDPEEYVRRSVANNLNDIAKDHPEVVSDVAAKWLKDADKNRMRLVKHACRTLIKQGLQPTLYAFGYVPVVGLSGELNILTPRVEYGEALEFAAEFLAGHGEHKVMIDYAIHFMKANGTSAPKVFKWKDTSITKGALSASRKHAIKPITTRKYYPGMHELEIFVNGVAVARAPFELVMS